MNKPNLKPANPNFSSGPTTKRPGWTTQHLEFALLGRSHRSPDCKARLKNVIEESKNILALPKDYLLGIMPGSDTGAIEAALWCLLGQRGVDVLAWENFGKDWVVDVVDQLQITNRTVHVADYGDLPNLSHVNFANDVIFTWNGTTSGVKVPNGDWIPSQREGLTICDATSAIFAMPIDYEKCDVITWSWQKVLGGEAAHGMLALSPRAVERLITYVPNWPIPKVFRLTNNKKVISGVFEGSTINTPSMICVEDAIETLNWVDKIGGLQKLIQRSQNSFEIIYKWIQKNHWISFLASKLDKKYLSNTSITFKIIENWFNILNENEQRIIMKAICKILSDNNVAFDINGYAKSPPSFRIWGGATVNTKDIEILLPWIEWSYKEVKKKYA